MPTGKLQISSLLLTALILLCGAYVQERVKKQCKEGEGMVEKQSIVNCLAVPARARGQRRESGRQAIGTNDS